MGAGFRRFAHSAVPGLWGMKLLVICNAKLLEKTRWPSFHKSQTNSPTLLGGSIGVLDVLRGTPPYGPPYRPRNCTPGGGGSSQNFRTPLPPPQSISGDLQNATLLFVGLGVSRLFTLGCQSAPKCEPKMPKMCPKTSSEKRHVPRRNVLIKFMVFCRLWSLKT